MIDKFMCMGKFFLAAMLVPLGLWWRSHCHESSLDLATQLIVIVCDFYFGFSRSNFENYIQCKPDISRLVGSMERYRDISGSAIYRATAMSQNPGQVFQRVVSGDGAFVCLAANSARRQRISWHLSKFDVALQNRVVEFQTKAVCA